MGTDIVTEVDFGVRLDFSALDRLPKDTDLPYSDGVPIDTPWHRAAIALLIETFKYHHRDRKDFFCGGDMFVYFSNEQVFNKDFRGPDFFVVNGVDRNRPRLSWVTWQENGRRPDVIVELSSPSTADVDVGPKRVLYRDSLQVPEYFIFDPMSGTFDGYQSREANGPPLQVTADNRVWSHGLGLFLGTWRGSYLGDEAVWVRFFTADGQMVPTGEERAALEASQAAVWREQAATEAARVTAVTSQTEALAAEIARLKAELAALKSPPSSPPTP